MSASVFVCERVMCMTFPPVQLNFTEENVHINKLLTAFEENVRFLSLIGYCWGSLFSGAVGSEEPESDWHENILIRLGFVILPRVSVL